MDELISYEQATGAAPYAPVPPSAPPSDASPDDSSGYAGRELTVRPRRADVAVPPPTVAAPIDAPTGAGAKPDAIPSDWISYEDAVRPPTPHPGGVLSNAADDSWLSGALKGTGTAAAKAVGNIIGAPTALHGFVDYLLARAESKFTGKPTDQILTELAQAKKEQQAHAASIGLPSLPDLPAPEAISGPILSQTGEYAPTTKMGRMAQAGTEAALSTLGPGAGMARGTAGTMLRATPGLAAGNAVAGSVGQSVTEATGDPLLGMAAGGLATPAAGFAAAGVRKAVGPVVRGTPGLQRVPFLGPKIGESRDQAAAQKIVGTADDPAALRDWASQPPTDAEVPDSPLTLAGTMGDDRRLFQAEKAARVADNSDFNAIDDAQAAAQKRAITAPYQDGDVFRPGQVIRDRLTAIDAAAEEAETRLRTAHEDAVAGRKDADQRTFDRMTLAFQDAHARATRSAEDATAPLNALPHPEEIGNTLRTAQAEATEAARQAKQALYAAVDPENSLATVVTPLKAQAATIRAAIDPHVGVQPSGAEARLHADIARLPDVLSFQALQKLDSRATAAMVDARRNPSAEDPEAIKRLVSLKGAVLDAIHNGIEHQAAHEQELVSRGLLAPENTVDARTRELVHGFFERQQQARVAAGQERPDGARRGAPAPDASGLRRAEGEGREGRGLGGGREGAAPPPGRRPDQPEVGGNLGYEAPGLGDRTVSARMHAPDTAAALGADVPGTVVRAYGGPLDRRTPAGQPGLIAFHGSPHSFERFDSARIGSGEGGQAYSHGLYFGENEATGQSYREGLSRLDVHFGSEPEAIAEKYLNGYNDGDRAAAIAELEKVAADEPDLAAKATAAAKVLRAGTEGKAPPGFLYQVRINRPSDHFLDWDKPFEQQSAYVREKLQSLGSTDGTGREIHQSLSRTTRRAENGLDVDHIDQPGAAAKMRDAGIAGVRYLDAGSRDANGALTHNYVVYNDGDIAITHRNDQPLARPVALPDMLLGQARASWGSELKAAGLRGDRFSVDLTRRALQSLKNGHGLDHGLAYERAHLADVPKEDLDAVVRGRAQRTGRQAADARGFGARPGQEGEAAGAGLGRRDAGQDRGGPRESLTANLDPAAVGRLKAAKAAHIAFEKTYKNPIVSGVLEDTGHAGQYAMPDSAIPAKWVQPGDKGYEIAKAFLAASDGDPRAIAAMENASVSLLRKHFPPAGLLHPNAVSRWQEHYAGSLRALDEVSPGFSSRFDTPANATQAVLDLGLQHKQALADFQNEAAARALAHDAESKATMQAGIARAKAMVGEARNSPAGKFLGQGGDRISPVEVENAVGNMLKSGTSGVTRMQGLVRSLSNNEDALTGLRKAGTDWMVRTFSNADGTMGAGFMKFYRDNREVMKELYGAAHTSMMGAVAHDIEVNTRWRTTTAAKGGSDTAANMRPMLSEGTKEMAKHASMMTASIEGLREGYQMGGWQGAGIAAAAPALYLLANLRSAGIRSVDALYREALANPEVARRLISKMPPVPEGGKLRELVGLLRRELIVGPEMIDSTKRQTVR